MSQSEPGSHAAGRALARHPLLQYLRGLEHSVERMGEPQNFRTDPAWLRLPAAKRELGLRRQRALLAYEKSARQMTDAERAAANAGVSLRQFYTLLSQWTENERSIWSLIPFPRGRTGHRTRLDPKVEAQLQTSIRGAIEQGRSTPRTILAAVRESWPSDLKIPRETTIRSHIESAGGLEVARMGPFSLNSLDAPQEEAETATKHGEVLVIDHTAPELFIDDDNPRRPTLTIAIDLFTGTIAGFVLREGPPSAQAVMDVLADAEKRSAVNPGHEIKPRIMVSFTNGSDWRDLANQLAKRQLHSTIRWGSRLHRGGPTKRLIGSHIADLPLLARKTHGDRRGTTDFEPKKHPLVTMAEARIVIEDAIARSTADRLLPGTVLNRLKTRRQ